MDINKLKDEYNNYEWIKVHSWFHYEDNDWLNHPIDDEYRFQKESEYFQSNGGCGDIAFADIYGNSADFYTNAKYSDIREAEKHARKVSGLGEYDRYNLNKMDNFYNALQDALTAKGFLIVNNPFTFGEFNIVMVNEVDDDNYDEYGKYIEVQ